MRRKRYLDERDRDIYEADLAEEAAWFERQVDADRAYYFRRQLRDYIRDDGYDPNDPNDRLEQEGGVL